MGVRDHQLDALETALDQSLQKARPERLRLRGGDAKTDDLASAFGGDRHGDYCGDRDDAATIADLQISRVEPQIRPFTVERAVEEGVDPLVDVFAQLGDLALRDTAEAHCLHQLVNPPGRDAADPGLLDHRDQRLLGSLARLEKRREVRSLAQLGNPQLQRAQARVQTTLAISVAVIEPVSAALVTAGADQAFDIGLHQNLQHRLGHGSQKIAITALLQQVNQRHSVERWLKAPVEMEDGSVVPRTAGAPPGGVVSPVLT